MQCAFGFCSSSLYKHKAEEDRPRAAEEVQDELSVKIEGMAASKLYSGSPYDFDSRILGGP